ncbi:MAG: hypothetical protein E7680_07625 [Ruminococcaceae bacterium]|nr:hypothetical protein [Oscillospiraceae bacterium]
MSYTDTVRQYCAKHKYEMLEVAKVREKEFADVPYKTLLKILNRLEEERIVTSISKGIYHIGPQILNEDKIISKYTSNGKGMLIGYSLFNSIGLTDYEDESIEIYSNAVAANQHNIGHISIKRFNVKFDGQMIDLISLLEILDAGFEIIGCNYMAYLEIESLLCPSYSDHFFKKVIKAHRYQYSTVLRLSEILKREQISNRCLEIYAEQD